ncbi:MAG: cysteine--tRNA ligase [bacterium]|nr:cysteine--tRNA ligase [bacterium]MDO8496409.1 cysteine--tRNA ligase [bacterium]
MNIYNTLTKTKEKLIPRQDKKIQMFVCGPTVYDYIHIGNARTFVFFDVVAKYLRQEEYEVDYIQNITDIDDKIIARAKESDREPLEYAKEYYEKFKEDMKALGVDSPRYIPATEHIEQVVKQVKTLIDKGHAYLIEDDGYYFDLSTFKDYGKLSGRKAQMADDAVSRIDENDKKKNKGDFCLWKFSKEGPGEGSRGGTSTGIASEPSWETKLGKGRPGWHIEDTAITQHYFGPQYDIHGGGQDLIFPHHEAEITQQESASGLKPFVKYWMHVAFLINKEQKMSKSVGNFETVNELLRKYSKETLRFYLLSGYYRQPLEFSDKMLKQSQAGVDRIKELIDKLELIEKDKENESVVYTFREEFDNALADDFNTPRAFAAIFELVKNVNSDLASDSISKNGAKEIKKLLEYANSILGIIPSERKEIPAEIQELAEKREKLREEKNYDESDKIRTQIQDLGYEVEDTIYGPLVSKNN